MIDARTHHALQRSVRKLAVDLVRDTDARRNLNTDTELAEREEQVQLEVRGTASTVPAWTTIDVPFQHTFVMSQDRRMSALERPHTYVGTEIVSSTPTTGAGDVIVTPNVVGWTFDDAGNITGARLRVGVQAPDGSTDFHAVVHATFQGYGVPTEPQPDMEM